VVELLERLQVRVAAEDGERGDVPGWVLIAIMTAGVVTALWAFMGSTFVNLFTDAINSVKGP
jgi:hypothetical protein